MNLIDINDLSRETIQDLFDAASDIKQHPADYHDVLKQKTLLMLFAKPSTRTRVSFETGMTRLGGHGIYFSMERSQLSRGESLKDTANVLSRYVDGIMARLFDHDDILALAEHADIPVINGLTDRLHPCQALADVFTMQEHGLDLADSRIVYVGDGNNVAHSLMQACTKLGADFVFSGPDGYDPDTEIVARAEAVAKASGGSITTIQDPQEAVQEADVLYTDVWVSMGDENEEERRAAFQDYQVNEDLVAASGGAAVMHPLPAHRGEEITSPVMDGEHAIVYDQAENRMHVQNAVLVELLG